MVRPGRPPHHSTSNKKGFGGGPTKAPGAPRPSAPLCIWRITSPLRARLWTSNFSRRSLGAQARAGQRERHASEPFWGSEQVLCDDIVQVGVGVVRVQPRCELWARSSDALGPKWPLQGHLPLLPLHSSSTKCPLSHKAPPRWTWALPLIRCAA